MAGIKVEGENKWLTIIENAAKQKTATLLVAMVLNRIAR
jgi:hypothetical protein